MINKNARKKQVRSAVAKYRAEKKRIGMVLCQVWVFAGGARELAKAADKINAPYILAIKQTEVKP